MAHTPGPWHIEPWEYAQRGTVLTIQTSTDAIAQVLDLWAPTTYREAEKAANARLIAAAPDLLEAAKAIVAYAREHGGPQNYTALLDLDAAIAKAEGTK